MNLSLLVSNVAAYSAQIAIIAVIAATVPRLLKMRAASGRLVFLQLALGGCLLLPLLRPWKQQFASGLVQVSTGAVAVAPETGAAHLHISWAAIIVLGLACGILFRLILITLGFLRLRHYRRNSRIFEEASAATGGAVLRLSHEIPTPVNFGLLHPVILLPEPFPDLDAATREAILCHEVLHVRRRDWAFTVVEELMRAFLWFHPAIWWMLGEIELARERFVDELVIGKTKARERYVDALLAMAGVQPPSDLALAPPFLRRRHLKQRLISILSEVQMSHTKAISTLAAGVAVLAISSWLVTGAFPLLAAPQDTTDAAGVTVDMNGSQVIHRTAINYPQSAITAGVQGTVVAQLKIDAKGNVSDASVISGPEELRKAVLESVLDWHFSNDAASSTRQIAVVFGLPKDVQTPPGGVAGSIPGPVARTATLINPSGAENHTVRNISIIGLSGGAKSDLLSQLPVHEGDTITSGKISALIGAVHQFDEHLGMKVFPVSQTEADVVIALSPPVPAISTSTGPVIRVGANVQAANLVTKVNPVYPFEAKQQRIQGVVKLTVNIGKDGRVQNITPVSGPPALVRAAIDAVEQWVYRPTLLNGDPVDVQTVIDINFTLSQ